MLYIEDPCEHEEVYDYDLFVPQREWSKIHVHLWAEHFNRPLKLRNKKMNSAFDREYIKMKGLYVFLDKSQILGKTYNKFYIPNICGKICKTFLQKYTSSKRYKKKIGIFNSKTPLLILRENTDNLPRLSFKTSKLDVRKKISSDKTNKIYSKNEYNFDQDLQDFSIPKTSNLNIRKEIPRVYKNKTIPSNSVSNSLNKIDKTKVFTPKSILKEKDDHLLKEQFLVFVDKNKNFVSNNKDSEAIDEHIVGEELNTEEPFISNNLKSSIKKSVRFNNTNLCSYEPSQVFVSDISQNNIVSSETELLFDQLVQKNIQIENKIEENVASDGIENLFRNSSEESILMTGIEDIVNETINKTFSPDNQDLEIVSTKTNSSSIDFILPTPEILDQNTNTFLQKPIYENTDRIDENEEGNIPVTINMVHHQDVIKKKLVEDSLNEYSVERNDLNVNDSSEYHINTTLKLNVSQLHDKKKSNMEIYNIIKESDTSEPSNQVTNETVDVIKEKEHENECLENVDVEYSSDSSGRVYEEDMYSQHYDNVCSFDSPQKIDSNASVVEDSKSVKNQNKYGESIIAKDSSTNAIVFDNNEQSDSKEIHICSDVDIESQLPLRISENNKFVIDNVILPTQSVSSAGNELVISDSEDVGNNEIYFENNNLDDITCCNYLTPISHKESNSQLIEAPKKDKTRNTYNNSSLNNTVKTLGNEPIVKDDTDKDIDHSKQIDTKLKKQLFYLPSEPKTINLSKNTESDNILNQHDISIDSELSTVNLKSLSKYGIITCKINYKTDKGFQKDTQRLKKNQVELINNEIEEDYINADIEQGKLEDLMMKNKNESSPQTVAMPNSENVSISCGIKYSDNELNKELNINHETNSLNEICIRPNHNLKDKTICEPNLHSSDENFLKVQKIMKKELKITLNKTLILRRKLKKCQDTGKYFGKNENIDNLDIIDQTSESNEKKVNGNERSKKQYQIYSSNKIVVNNTLISHEKNSDIDYIEKSIPTADQENYVFVADQNQQMFSNDQRTIHDIFHHLNEGKSNLKINEVEHTLHQNNDRQIQINMDKFKQQNSESYNEYQTVDNDFSAGESEWFKEVQRELINKSKYLHQEDEQSMMNSSVLTTEYLTGKNNKPFEMNNVRLEDDNVLKQLAKANNDQIRLDSEDNICKDDLFSSYDKDFQTLPQKNISNKLLSNITSDKQVIESNVQLVVNNQNSEDSNDLIITPEIDCQLSLKRKKQKVKHNTDVKSLSSSIKQNEESDAYCITTENVVDTIQPHLSMISEQENQKMNHQEIGPLNPEVNRQSFQNNIESENNYFFIKRKIRKQKHLLNKSINPEIIVTESNVQTITNTIDNGSVEEFYEQSGLIKSKSKQKVNRREDHNIIRTESLENFFGKTNSTSLSNYENQSDKRRILQSEPLVASVYMENIDVLNGHDKLFLGIDSTVSLREETHTEGQQTVNRSDPFFTEISVNIKDINHHDDFFENTNSTILSNLNEVQKKKRPYALMSEDLVIEPNKQCREKVKDIENNENILAKINSITLSNQGNQRKKQRRNIRSEPLVPDISRQPKRNIEVPNSHGDDLFCPADSNVSLRKDTHRDGQQSAIRGELLCTDMSRQSLENIKDQGAYRESIGNTNTTSLLKKDIQREKHQHIIRSGPLVTGVIKESLENIIDIDDNGELFENNNPNILSRQEIERKKHRSVVRSKPLVTDVSRQSLENIEQSSNHGNLLGMTEPTILSKKEIQRKKYQSFERSEPLVTDISKQSLEHIKDPDNHENLFENVNNTILSKQKIQGENHRSVVRSKPLVTNISGQSLEHIEDLDEPENLSRNINDTILSKQKIQGKKHGSVVKSELLVTDISRQSLKHIEEPDEPENCFGNTNNTILSKQKIQGKNHRSVVRSEPLVTDINRQSLKHIEDPEEHENCFGNTNPTILSKQKIQGKKHRSVVRLEPFVTDINRQSLEHIEDPDEHDNLVGNINDTILSKQKIQGKKHRSVVRSEPLVIDNNRQSLEHIEDPHEHGNCFGNTNLTILSKQKIQGKKHRSVVRSEPFVTDINRQSLEHIEDPDEHDNLVGNINDTILSKQKIQGKKHRSVVRSEPLVIDNNRQSLEHFEDPDEHENCFGKTNPTILSKQKIQGKKHGSVVRSEPLVTDVSRQSLTHIDDPDEHENCFGNTNPTILSTKKILSKKHGSVVRSDSLVTDISRQSLKHIEEPDEPENCFGNTNNTIFSKQKIQGKKHRSVVRSKPLVTDISRQSLIHIEDPEEHENCFGNTNPTILSKRKIQGKKHGSVVRSEPLVTDISRQSLKHIEEPDEPENCFGNTNNTILSKQKIQGKKHGSVVRSEPLVTDISRRSLEHIEDPDEPENCFGKINPTILSKQKIQGKKHGSVVRSEPLVTDISRQSLNQFEDPEEHENCFGNTNNTILSKQKIQGKKHRSVVRSEPLVTDISRRSLEHIEDPDEPENCFGNTNNTIFSKQKIQGKKHRSVVRSEPLVTDISRQPLKHIEEPEDLHDLFGNKNFATSTRQEFQRIKYRHIIRSESLVTDVSSQSFINNKYLDNDDLISIMDPTISSRQEIHKRKHLIRSESLVTDICSPSIGNIDSISDHNNFFMHIDDNSSDYQFVNMEDYFLKYRKTRNFSQQNAHKSRNRSSSHVVPINYTSQVLERQSPFSIISSYSEKESVNPVKPKRGSIKPTKIPTFGGTLKSNCNSTSSPRQSINIISRKSGLVDHNSQTISERCSSTTEPEEDLNTVNSDENQLQYLGITDNEYDINLLSDEDLKEVTCTQKSSSPSSGNISQDERICETLWSETTSRSSSGDVFGFDIELPSYDDSPNKENISISSMTEYNNITSDDSQTSP